MKRSLEYQQIDLITENDRLSDADLESAVVTSPGNRDTQLDTNDLDQLVQRIVEIVDPLRIILFGSAARGEMGPDSDVDVLVVMPEGIHRRKTAQNLHTKMSGIPFPVDILVTTPEDLEKHKENIGLIYYRILEEGKEIYAA